MLIRSSLFWDVTQRRMVVTYVSAQSISRILESSTLEDESFGSPRKRFLDDVENDLKKMSVRNWRKIARDKDA
jgi:DNA primase catalytic subunit